MKEQLTQKTYEQIQACIKAQKDLCDNNPNYRGWHFAPHSGICYDCRLNIYQNYGNSLGCTGESYITGCPHCKYSFCE